MASLSFNAVPSDTSSVSINSRKMRRCSLNAFNLILVIVSSLAELKKFDGVKFSIALNNRHKPFQFQVYYLLLFP